MNGQWLPEAALRLEPLWLNAFANPWLIQFLHRWTGTLLLLAVGWLWVASGRHRALLPLAGLTAAQYALGVATLLYAVPAALGVAHQACAGLLVLALTRVLHTGRRVDRAGNLP
jgi:cytochrome c oxidase assembly protein subunit 15